MNKSYKILAETKETTQSPSGMVIEMVNKRVWWVANDSYSLDEIIK